jgi:hypothetical protein
MARVAEAGLTKAEGRRFAFTLAIAFAVIALAAQWRGRDRIALDAWVLSALLLAAGLFVPTRLRPVERAWMNFGAALARITSPLFLGVVYFVVFTPAGWIRRVFGGNPIAHHAVENSYWKIRPPRGAEERRRGMERQF